MALAAWAELAETAFSERTGIEPVQVEPIWDRWIAIADMLCASSTRALLSTPWEMEGNTAWQVITTPIDLTSPVLPVMVLSLSTRTDRFDTVLREIRINAAGMLVRLWEDVAALEQLATKTISKKLAASLKSSTFGVCADCGVDCVPNFARCDRCHSSLKRGEWAA